MPRLYPNAFKRYSWLKGPLFPQRKSLSLEKCQDKRLNAPRSFFGSQRQRTLRHIMPRLANFFKRQTQVWPKNAGEALHQARAATHG